jgi:hypothetical protein
MRRTIATVLLAGLGFYIPSALNIAHADAVGGADVKEWTFLIYLNGHNNLDSFGALNINQMEQVGSSKDLNIVVQWASEAAPSTKRLLVQKDTDPRTVTSPIVEDMGRVDMGDWRTLVDFVQWASVKYPAKHYFIDVWDHGSGWHAMQLQNQIFSTPGQSISGSFTPMDISWDDESGNHMTTAQLGTAMTEIAKIIGHKVDLYGSDACLMAMAEIAAEMADSVEIFAGSEEVEPGAGWPYQTFLKRWAARPLATASEVGTFLSEEYVKSYQGGVNGNSDVTFSIFDVTKLPALNNAVATLTTKILKLDAAGRKAVLSAAKNATNFDFSDYVDFGDFLSLLDSTRSIDSVMIEQARAAIKDFVVAKGVALWIPTSKYTFNAYSKAYKGLQFDAITHWSDALAHILQDPPALQ